MSKNDGNKTSRKDGRKCKRNRHLIRFLVSCCLFLFVLCGCMLAALVLIGKHYVENRKLPQENAYQEEDTSEIRAEPSAIYRLANDTLPHHYDLQFHPDLTVGTFSGKANITLEILRPRDFLILHANNLTVHHAEIYYANATNDDVNVIKVEPAKLEVLLIHFNKLVKIGFYHLYIEFSGTLLDRIWGFYRSQYFDEIDNSTRTIATSKFEPTYARQAYPCFDEPNMKAKFTVHLLKPSDERYVALSNMPQVSEEETKDGTLVHFQESVKMSTYLTCFIVSDFTYTENFILPETYNIPFRVYATPAQLNKTTFATETGVKIIEFYINYFGIPYPLPKLDLVGIPDFVSGAMEHWGLVTFRETALLYDKSISSTANKQRVASVISHELAHSWFGNLVTMNWWDELWLNEGFASYIQYKGVNAVYPEWQMLDQFLIEDLHSVLAFDARLSSHAIVQKVETPDQITAIFDQISYSKGASILRMLEDAVTEETFQKGVTNYLKAHLYGNAITLDLLNELQKIVGDELNVIEFVNTWTNQMGYPILDVKINGDDYVLTQKRFLIDPSGGRDAEPSPYNYKWSIPVTYITSDNSTPQYVWFNHDATKIIVKKPASSKWLKFNHKQVGYYRVNYEDWNEVLDNVHEMSVMDRTHLLEETFSIAAAGQLNYEIPLNLIKYMKAEENYIPWTVAHNSLVALKNYLTHSVVFEKFKDIVIDIVDPIYQRLTWNETDSEGHLEKLARVTVLGLACKFEHPECIEEAKEQFAEWLNGDKVLSQDLKGLIYEYGMKEATVYEWDQLWDTFIRESDASEKLRLLKGLASVNNPSQLTRLLELAKTDEYIRKQDYFTCLGYISANPIGTLLVWDYVRENWPYLVKRFTLNDRYLGSLIPTIVKSFSTVTKREELVAFYEKYPEAGAGEAARKRALEIVDNNIKWLSANKRVVENWIKNQNL